MIDSDQRPDSNRRPFQMLRSMADLFIMVKAYIIGRRFEKVRNDHIFGIMCFWFYHDKEGYKKSEIFLHIAFLVLL
jgi:hypothetical protein